MILIYITASLSLHLNSLNVRYILLYTATPASLAMLAKAESWLARREAGLANSWTAPASSTSTRSLSRIVLIRCAMVNTCTSAQYCTVLYSIVLYCSLLYCTVLCCLLRFYPFLMDLAFFPPPLRLCCLESHRALPELLPERGLDEVISLQVHCSRGLVQHQHPGLPQHRPGQAHQLPTNQRPVSDCGPMRYQYQTNWTN